MTLPEFSLKYSRCTSDELRTFLVRRGTKPELKTKRRVYIRDLRKLDKQSTFRFLDLPPEMRVLVYAHLLSYRECDPAHVAILRACRLIHKEALDVFHSESRIPLDCFFLCAGKPFIIDPKTSDPKPLNFRDHTPSERTYTYARVVSPVTGTCVMMDYTTSSEILAALRPLRQFSRLRLYGNYTKVQSLAVGDYTDSQEWTTLSRFLTELVRTCRRLQFVKFRLNLHGDLLPLGEARKQFISSLQPLMDLPSSCTLDLRGLTDEEYQKFWSMAAESGEQDTPHTPKE